MREIKFRVRNKETKKIVHGLDNPLRFNPDTGELCVTDDYLLEQFTGLTDKHGKDVFEGDVIEWEPEPDGSLICNVEWIESVARFACITKTGEGSWLGAIHDEIEIIGNIHQTNTGNPICGDRNED